MSGHSKWANIRVKKTAQDAKRGKVFTRHARLIEIAASAGKSGDPSINASLRSAIDNAKADSVPNANIERAIKKGLGELKGEQMQEMLYEAYGPGSTAYIIECLSDNRNRTTANVRTIVTKHGGRMADSGSVAYQFERKGTVAAEFPGGRDAIPWRLPDDVELALIDRGAEDIVAGDGIVTVTTAMIDWSRIRDFLKDSGATIHAAGVSFVAKAKMPVDDVMAQKVVNFMESIEEDEDVSEVYTNADV